ncbi:putative entry exclusion protein TrbK-alt [Bartonella sp. LJL80]
MLDTPMIKRLTIFVAIVVALVAIAGSYLQMRDNAPYTPPVTVIPNKEPATKTELKRCKDLGQAATSDPACLKTWKDARDTFLGSTKKGR